MDGRWHVEDEAWTNWTEGFLGGLLWIFARRTGDPWWRDQAEHYCPLIEPRKDDRNVHDLGFLFISTWKRWFEATGDPPSGTRSSMPVGRWRCGSTRRAATSARSSPPSRVHRHHDERRDHLRSGPRDGRRGPAADRHRALPDHPAAPGSRRRQHRARGDLRPRDRRVPAQRTHQGWRADSSWARGQAWALYGFGTAYALSGDERFLDTAERCADFFLDRTGRRVVPPNDWEEPIRRALRVLGGRYRRQRPWQLADLTTDRAGRRAIATRPSRS